MSGPERRLAFDEVALAYAAARPGYPPALVDDVVAFAGLRPGDRLLEIGCGTGQATLPFAQRGYHIECVELGARLAVLARARLAGYPGVAVHTVAFERWPLPTVPFDLVLSATAFHWIDPAVRYVKAAQALRAGGSLALFWNRPAWSEEGAAYFAASHPLYLAAAPALAQERTPGLPRPEAMPAPEADEIAGTGLFGPVTIWRYPWARTYTAAEYVAVLDTYSDHRALDPPARERLFADLAALINTRFAGRITRVYVALLYLAHKP